MVSAHTGTENEEENGWFPGTTRKDLMCWTILYEFYLFIYVFFKAGILVFYMLVFKDVIMLNQT